MWKNDSPLPAILIAVIGLLSAAFHGVLFTHPWIAFVILGSAYFIHMESTKK
jgi:hypothetical protein